MFSNRFRKGMAFKNEERTSETVSCASESEIHQKTVWDGYTTPSVKAYVSGVRRGERLGN